MAKNVIKKALTFDDVLLVPQKSSVLPKEVNCYPLPHSLKEYYS